MKLFRCRSAESLAFLKAAAPGHQADNETEGTVYEEEDGTGTFNESSAETGLPPFTDEEREGFGLGHE
ncbi:hypothetical protein VCV18_012740 [Metarhizium anisopliae]